MVDLYSKLHVCHDKQKKKMLRKTEYKSLCSLCLCPVRSVVALLKKQLPTSIGLACDLEVTF